MHFIAVGLEIEDSLKLRFFVEKQKYGGTQKQINFRKTAHFT